MKQKQTIETLNRLENNADHLERFVETVMVDECGLLLSYINPETLKSRMSSDYKHFEEQPVYNKKWGNVAEQLNYEDSLMATGEYASAMLTKYEVIGDVRAMTTAVNQIFALLRVLYEGEYHEKGFMPKPFGGMRKARFSHEISPDQYTKSFVALRHFRKYASESLKKVIDDYTVAIADYFMNRNFCYPYRERILITPETHLHSLSILLPSLTAAAQITGDDKYIRIMSRFDKPLETLLSNRFERHFNISSLLIEGFSCALLEGLSDERLKKIIKIAWDSSCELLKGDGWGYHNINRDIITSRVLHMSASAPIVDYYFPELNALEQGVLSLQTITNPLEMRYMNTATESNSATSKFFNESICETSITSWLLGYWRTRQRERANNNDL